MYHTSGSYNDIEKTEEVLSTIPPEILAAILVDPMVGSGGAIAGSLSFPAIPTVLRLLVRCSSYT